MTITRTEKSITKEIIQFIRSLPRGWAIKTHGGAFTAGEPDISGCLNGVALHFEVKRNSALSPTPLQYAKLLQWEEAGAITGVVASVEDVRTILLRHGVSV